MELWKTKSACFIQKTGIASFCKQMFVCQAIRSFELNIELQMILFQKTADAFPDYGSDIWENKRGIFHGRKL